MALIGKTMNFSRLTLGLSIVALVGCNPAPKQGLGEESAPILNGIPAVDDAERAASPVVSIVGANPFQPWASGTLLGKRTVLTAAHVLQLPGLVKEQVLVDHAMVDHVGPSGKSAKVSEFIPYTGFRTGVGGPVGPVDIAILSLDQDVADDTVDFPELDCDKAVPQLFECQSGIRHVNVGNATVLHSELNRGLFEHFTSGRNVVQVFPFTPPTPVPGFTDTILLGGDSGTGCVDSVTGELTAIAQGVRKDVPKVGVLYLLHSMCNWIREETLLSEAGSPQAHVTFEQHVDTDQQKDLIKVSALAVGALSITIDSTELGEQPFTTSQISGTPALQSGAIGNFTGSKKALVVVADGALVAASFNSGPLPAITGGPSGVSYRVVSQARIDGDKIDDLVAQQEGGQIDVYLGSATGLKFSANIHPFVTRLDDDSLPDFVWLNGDSGIHTSSSKAGHTFRDVIPTSIDLDSGKAGRFRGLDGDAAGIEDIAVLGDGLVIWCKSTTFGGVECEPALDAPFASGRIATDIAVADLTEDGLDDLTISYSNAKPRIILGQQNGFSPQFGFKVRAVAAPDLNGDLIPDTVTFDDPNGQISIAIRVGPEGAGDLGPIATGIPFDEPFAVAVGNVNDDGTSATALTAGLRPIQDVVVMSGGVVFSLLSNGDGTVEVEELDGEDGFVAISVRDVTGDGVDDVEATKADGSVTVYTGGPGGLVASGNNYTGLPTPNSDDGKMLLLSGQGVDTVGSTQARLRIRVGAGDNAALDHLDVQVFDGNNSGLHQFDEETSLLKTCYRLSADPCGDGNAGNCSGGPIAPTTLLTVSSDSLGDDKWDTIFNGPHSPQASLTGNGQPPFTYELRVYLSQDCATLPSAGSQISVATADAFKVRSNGMLSQPLGEFSLVGSDSDGPFGVAQPYMRNTAFDGSFSLPISVGSSATEIQLKESDADDTEDGTPGVSLGANAAIQYRLLKPDGSPASLVGADDSTPTLLVTNPSGNNDGQSALDVETRIHTISGSGSGSGSGTWTWQWENVRATNAIHVFSPFGSPTTHEVMGARRSRPMLTTAQQPTFWQSDAALSAQLPITLGQTSVDGEPVGSALVIASVESARAVLANSGADSFGELARQLLTAKLNWQRGLSLGEDIKGALVYGRTKAVRSVFGEADGVVSGIDGLADEARIADLVSLLSAVNLGEVNYQQPGVPFPEEPMADDDHDGVVNVKDNCPAIANPQQEDADDDWIGDACHVVPKAVCVLERSETAREAVFGYANPLTFRGIPQGARNQLAHNGAELWDSLQPTELLGGTRLDAFRFPVEAGDTLSWTLDGETASIDAATPTCSGRELTNVPLAPQTALFGTEGVQVGERCLVTSLSGSAASIVSAGDVMLEASSSVGNVFAGGRVIVADLGVIRGTAATSAGVVKSANAQVNAARMFVAVPHSLAWWVGFQADGLQDFTIGASEQRELPPGDYGDIVVTARGQVLLRAGRYRFRSLVVLEQGSLRVGSAETILHVQSRLQHAGDTRISAGGQMVLGYLGSEPAFIDASIAATVVAPNAELTLGRGRQSVYVGSFAAKRVVLRPETQVAYASWEG